MKLIAGRGSPKTGACWMSAIAWYAGYKWTDHPDCVDPLIGSLCITLNDRLPSDEERERVIGPHLMTPIGTNQGAELTQRRVYRCLDVLVKVMLPKALEAAGKSADAAKLRAMPEIVDKASAKGAIANAIANADAIANASAYAIAYANANAIAHAIANADADADAIAHAIAIADADAIAHAIAIAYAIANAIADADTDAIAYAIAITDAIAYAITIADLLAIILELCAMGERREVLQVRCMAELP